MTDISSALLQFSAPEAIQIVFLIFGGCCSNVWALESILKTHPGSGTFLTFSQFIFVTIQNLGKFLEWPNKVTCDGQAENGSKGWMPRLKKREVPLKRWMGQVVLYLGISLLNNYAFGLKIPMTLHIIFRSGGLCVSMLTSYFVAGRRYSPGQITAGLMITAGIVLATLSAPSRRPATASTTSTGGPASSWASSEYAAGVAVLSIALVLSSVLGLFQEETYKRYGKAWQEGLFYSHLLSIPFFLPFYPDLISTFRSYASSPPTTLLSIPTTSGIAALYTDPIFSGKPVSSTPKDGLRIAVPSALLALAINVLTQGLCIRGVNRLTAKVSSTTVNLVLTVRKAVSLGISVWYYGSGLTPGLVTGGTMVLLGTVLYSFASSPLRSQDVAKVNVNNLDDKKRQ